MPSSTIFPDISELDRAYARVSIRSIFVSATPLPVWRLGEPPSDPAPMPVVSGPRLPLAGPGRAAVVEVTHG